MPTPKTFDHYIQLSTWHLHLDIKLASCVYHDKNINSKIPQNLSISFIHCYKLYNQLLNCSRQKFRNYPWFFLLLTPYIPTVTKILKKNPWFCIPLLPRGSKLLHYLTWTTAKASKLAFPLPLLLPDNPLSVQSYSDVLENVNQMMLLPWLKPSHGFPSTQMWADESHLIQLCLALLSNTSSCHPLPTTTQPHQASFAPGIYQVCFYLWAFPWATAPTGMLLPCSLHGSSFVLFNCCLNVSIS